MLPEQDPIEKYRPLLEKYPFITYLVYGGNEYIGIVQNVDDILTTVYDYGSLKTAEHKEQFLAMGEVWWWESNRAIPINVFLRQDWIPFRYTLKTMNSRDVDIRLGPYVSLREIIAKRSKRRSITLVRKLP